MLDQIYPPSEDSELLLEAALKEVRPEDDVLEVGVGSGFVSSQLMDKCKFLLGTDISPAAVKEARKKGIEVLRTRFSQGIDKRFSLILFNPPYLELKDKEKRNDWIERAIDGGKHGVEVTSRFLSEVKGVMKEDGRIILITSSTSFPFIESEIKYYGFVFQNLLKKRVFFEELYALRLQLD